MDKKNKEISLQAKMLRKCIQMATSEHLIGPKIKDGTLRKKVKEPQWHCPEGYSFLRIQVKKCYVEILTPPKIQSNMVVLQMHGGGYIGRMKNASRNYAKEYADMRNGMKVYSLDYRVAPRHPYPAALHDAVAVYHLLESLGYDSGQIILAGDSAGGGLCLALCAYLRDHGKSVPAHAVLMSPWTDLTASGSSYEENYTKDPLFGNTKESMIYSGEYYAGHDPHDPYISPIFDSFKEFPRMLFQVGSIEMLLSDTLDAVAKAKEAGCKVDCTVYDGMFHEFQMANPFLPEAKKAWQEVKEFIERIKE